MLFLEDEDTVGSPVVLVKWRISFYFILVDTDVSKYWQHLGLSMLCNVWVLLWVCARTSMLVFLT